MTYHDDPAETFGEREQSYRPFHDRVREHRVGAFLRSQGYAYYPLGSWFAPTRHTPQATRNLNYHTLVPHATMRLLDNVLIAPVRRTEPLTAFGYHRQHWDRIVRQVD